VTAAPSPSFGRRLLGLVLWLAVVLLLAEGAVRAAGLVLRRDQDFGAARSAANVVYCVGDSFTYGQGVEPAEAWPRVLASLLRAEDEASAPAVRILAEPGRSSSLAILDVARALKAGDARLLLIMTGWNANDGDFAAYAAQQDRGLAWTARVNIWLAHSRLYRVVKHAITYRGRTLVLDDVEIIPQTIEMQLYDFRAYQEIARQNLRRIARMCHAAGVPCAFVTYPHQELPPNPYTRTEYYHALFGRTPLSEADYLVQERRPGEIALDAVIRRVSEREDIPLIDTQRVFAAAGEGLFLADWHHPTAAGHDLIARTVFSAISGTAPP